MEIPYKMLNVNIKSIGLALIVVKGDIMPIKIIEGDITKLKVDAIVNAANKSLLGGGGVDGAIHAAAGKQLLEDCKTLGGCKTGDAKITKGYNLPAKYIIHTVGPIWNGGKYNEKQLLTSCYKNSLELAKSYNFESIAFPLISSGAYGYPKDQALQVAIDAISSFLLENDMMVYIVVFDKNAFQINPKLYVNVKKYIVDYGNKDEFNEDTASDELDYGVVRGDGFSFKQCRINIFEGLDLKNLTCTDDIFDVIDESFSEMLLRKIDEKGMTDPECYKRANVDRKLFSKIRNNKHYQPAKQTAVAFAIALELDLKETTELLKKAGFALSHSNKFDLIIEYFIKNREYNIYEINQVLFAFDQKLLGV